MSKASVRKTARKTWREFPPEPTLYGAAGTGVVFGWRQSQAVVTIVVGGGRVRGGWGGGGACRWRRRSWIEPCSATAMGAEIVTSLEMALMRIDGKIDSE